eukprot:scaffold83121_cov33-Prasinocladus_malaysianus.AAC.1
MRSRERFAQTTMKQIMMKYKYHHVPVRVPVLYGRCSKLHERDDKRAVHLPKNTNQRHTLTVVATVVATVLVRYPNTGYCQPLYSYFELST